MYIQQCSLANPKGTLTVHTKKANEEEVISQSESESSIQIPVVTKVLISVFATFRVIYFPILLSFDDC